MRRTKKLSSAFSVTVELTSFGFLAMKRNISADIRIPYLASS